MPRPREFDYDDKLAAARNLFWKKGYNATSMSDLVDTMQINRSSLYLTYGNKHDLFLKSLSNYIQMKNLQYSEASNKGKDSLEAVANVINSVCESALLDNNCLFTNSIFELALTDEKVNRLIKNQSLKAVELFEKLLKQAKEEGSLESQKDPLALAHFLVSGLVSIYTTHILFADKKLTKETAKILINSIK